MCEQALPSNRANAGKACFLDGRYVWQLGKAVTIDDGKRSQRPGFNAACRAGGIDEGNLDGANQ